MQIKINNWSKFQQRVSGYVKPWWFSFSNTFLEDPDIWDFSDAEKVAFIYLLCLASKTQKDTIRVNFNHASRSSNVEPDSLRSAIRKAESFGMVAIICTESDHDLSNTIQDKIKQNKQVPNGTSPVVVNDAPKRKSSIVDLNSPNQVYEVLPRQTLERWALLYPDNVFLEKEFLRAVGYYLDNPKKKPKSVRGWCQAISSWLDRGWSKHAQFQKGNTTTGIDWNNVFGEEGK